VGNLNIGNRSGSTSMFNVDWRVVRRKHCLVDVLHGVRSDKIGGDMRGAGTIIYPNQQATHPAG
jgi:hypothetical protein